MLRKNRGFCDFFPGSICITIMRNCYKFRVPFQFYCISGMTTHKAGEKKVWDNKKETAAAYISVVLMRLLRAGAVHKPDLSIDT